ncbi:MULTISPECIES: chromate transporter [unclassified Bacillus (in: firmicutes)]|uniref:chromate transporter n=1 Tax=unclassified Bacillus (in: firmicutes) TaxID=185979 RepID=UPI000BEF579F|nr:MULTISPECIES: chromate transporter [unclassified Bacillus (in: firmicutes)]PEJ60651.1 transporter [Bacillus sp. AFS002410]PEL09842.1 transporter [Bacillus sp. AFS017336]
MVYWNIFWSFFVANILGYGGGPATIPLIQKEVIARGWLTHQEFNEALAMGNSLPGPIATKMAGYIGFHEGGILGSFLAVFATVAPSLILMLTLMGILYKYRHSIQVKRMTLYVKPTIAVLLGVMAYNSFHDSYSQIGIGQFLFLGVISYILMEKVKLHPAFIVMGALLYGGLNL